MENFASLVPDSKVLISGFIPKCPINCTLFLKLFIIFNFIIWFYADRIHNNFKIHQLD